MILFLTALDPQINQRNFSCQLSSIEEHFDFLNHLVSQGHTLLSAYIMEDTSRTDLPLAAFDGLPMSMGVQALEQDWRAILNKPCLPALLYQPGLIELMHRRITTSTASIAAHKRMIDKLTSWILRMQATTRSTIRSSLLMHYDSQLVTHQASLVKAQHFANVATNRLSQLMA